MFQLHRLGLAEMLVAFRHIQTIEPGFLCRASMVKEQNVGRNRCIWGEHTTRHTDDGMDIELREQLRLDCYFGIVCAKQEAIRQNDSCAAIFLQSIHNNGHEQVSRFAAGKVSRKWFLISGFSDPP